MLPNCSINNKPPKNQSKLVFRYFIGAPCPISIFSLAFATAANATFTTHTHTHTQRRPQRVVHKSQTDMTSCSTAWLLLPPTSSLSAPLRRCFSRFWRLRCTNCRLFAQPWQENSQLPAACCASATQFKNEQQQQLQQQNWEKLQTNGKQEQQIEGEKERQRERGRKMKTYCKHN